ncbi:hypothetical protein MXMO3_02479 [Maritalea myrionectae]|uniref:Uncharacterized protein n=1 Tax=Maritalea myrionectae TaxID=454601 RepID=A0A2R4MG21_9HYPH|nr:hypothetical protein [Maritalea myrionectae]AVX04991.1 hypothetical protein MXMO3_02479 [Maritalea myrionectae]
MSTSYYPMPARGDLLYPLKITMVPMLIVTAIVMLIIWFRSRPLKRNAYLFGLVAVSIIALLPFLPHVDNGYKQVQYIGTEKFEVPWQYSPYGGTERLGGEYFNIRVNGSDLAPKYNTMVGTMIVGISTKKHFDHAEDVPEDGCVEYSSNRKLRCQFAGAGYNFTAAGDRDLFPENKSILFSDIAALFDSFRADKE